MSVDYRPVYDPADVDSDYGHTGGNITVPTFTGDTRPFRFWCQKALPLVYDDSLSYYEVLCKMADYMNNFMTDLTTVEDSMTEFGQQFVINQQFISSMADQLGQNVADLEAYINDRMDDFMSAYTQLQSYVNNYFDNLDVQQEINSKLDDMASDGTLNDLFDPVLETWMQQKTAQIDAAIANQDTIQAAQNARISVLEGRMDTFSGLPSGSTSGNAELLDIRTNFLGETYPTAGDAVRASDMIASGFLSIPITRLEEWNGNEASSTYDTIQFDVSAYKGGHIIMIANMEDFVSTAETVGVGVYATNVSGKTADQNAHAYALTSTVFPNYSVIPTQIAGEERIALFFSIPDDFSYQYLKMGYVEQIPVGDYTQPAAIVYANSWSKTEVDPTLEIAGAAADAKATGDAIDELNERIDDRISGVNFSANGNLYNTQALVENKYIDPNSGKIASTTYTGFAYSKTYINVTSGETICSNTRMFIAYYDNNLNIVSALQMDNTKKTVVPSGAVYARFSASAPDQYAVVVQRGESLNSDKNDYTFSLDGLNINPFSLGAQQYKSLMNFEPSDNLYNVYAIVKQKYIDPSSGKIISTSSDTWACSTTYIPVSSGDVLTATDRMIIAYYDDEYNVISAMQMDATKQTTVPANASFARFSVSANDHSAVKVVKGTSINSSVGTYSFRLKGLSVGEGVIVVDANGDGDYTSFTEAIYENVDDGRDVIVKAGTYNIVSEYIALFGQSVVDNLADSTGGMNNFQYGVRIHNRKVTFESGSHLVCDWTGHTVNGSHRFCPLRVEPNAHIVGLDLDCTATFYGIHDDYGTADNSPFTIKYENCRVIGHNLYNANCIGGGAHKYSRHIIHNCYFKNNVSSSDIVLSADVRYHNTNTADAEPELYVSNCYFSNNMNITYYGTQTTKFRAYVNNCFAPHGIIKRSESASMTTDNVELYAWNNHTN